VKRLREKNVLSSMFYVKTQWIVDSGWWIVNRREKRKSSGIILELMHSFLR
jgi:hypothetical protein